MVSHQTDIESSSDFWLAYSGEALTENTMDVRDLAPALIAFGELFTRANTLLNGKDISVSLKVRATQPGSFELYLLLVQGAYVTTQFLSSSLVTSAANLITLTSATFAVFRKLKGQTPIAIETSDGVTLEATNLKLHIPAEVFRLVNDNDVKKLSQAVVEPLLKKGINKMVIRDKNKELESISKEDAEGFMFSGISSSVGTENIAPKVYLRLVSPQFDIKKAKWRLDDGSGNKWYSIDDDRFIRDVKEQKVRFGMGDYLVCKVKTIQRITDEGLEVDRAILSVIEHVKAGEQLPFISPS